MKKIISLLMSAMMLLAGSTAAFADGPPSTENAQNVVTTIPVTIKEPTVGEQPATSGTLPEGASTCITDIQWSGTLDENGCFQYGASYLVAVSVAIKDGIDKIIDNWYVYAFTINGKQAIFEYMPNSETSGVLYYKYQNLGVPHQNHCFCGGELTLGEHTDHQTFTYQPWNGKSTIPYIGNTAYVYLTADVSRSQTLNIAGNKTLNLCLNGHTIQMTGGGRVINISSGGKLRLCDCSAMQTGTITGGSHNQGGGIHNGGTFIMYGGKVRGNRSTYGGGLWNNYNFCMYGGEICYNYANCGGGMWNANSGDAVCIIFDGSINKNESSYGGGLWNNDNGNVTMKGGEFRENIAGKSGGAVWNQGKLFLQEGGFIYKNFAQYGGGIWNQSAYTMAGGYIVSNAALFPYNRENGYGGGVWVNDKGTFLIKNGEISGNIAGACGGGIWVNDSADVVMQSGIVSGNLAQQGGGVYIQRSENTPKPGTFYLSGDARVYGNNASVAGGGMYIKGVLEITGGTVESNSSSSEYVDLAIEPIAEIREGTTRPTQFIDVPADAYYCEPVLWALENNITTGTSEITFSPNESCNWGQILTFLWRAAGSPVVETKPLIADVYPEDYFYMAAYWAQSLGIFERALYPNTSSNRLTSVYCIWCAAGRPECKTPLTFTDTQDPRYEMYYEAIAWAVEQGITNGTSETTFSPGKSCTRAEIVTLLYRAASKGFI